MIRRNEAGQVMGALLENVVPAPSPLVHWQRGFVVAGLIFVWESALLPAMMESHSLEAMG